MDSSVDGEIPERKFPRTLELRHLVHEAQDFDSVLTPSFVGFYNSLFVARPVTLGTMNETYRDHQGRGEAG